MYIGVVLDQALNYEKFMLQQLRTVNFITYQLGRLGDFLDVNSAVLLYKTYILPILEYGDILIVGNICSRCSGGLALSM